MAIQYKSLVFYFTQSPLRTRRKKTVVLQNFARFAFFVRIGRLCSFFFLITIGAVFLSSCNPTKKLIDKEYLVNKNIIIDKGSGMDKTLIESYIRQKPNRKVFRLFYFHTWLYNTVDPDKNLVKKNKRNEKYKLINAKRKAATEEKNKKRMAKRDKKNQERIAKGKRPLKQKKALQPKLKDLEKLTFGEKLQEIGEAAVVLDTFLTKVSTEQIKKFFNNNGYFNASVRDSIVYEPVKGGRKQKKRANVYYIINASLPYYVRNVSYKSDDVLLGSFVMKDSMISKIKPGMRYNGDSLTAERTRIYKSQLNNGYYEFTPEFVYFLVDSNLNSHKMDITVGIKDFAYKVEREELADTIMFRDHIRYYLNNIYVITDYSGAAKVDYRDTSIYEKGDSKFYFLHNGKMWFRKSVLAGQITIAPGQLYNYSAAEETYRRLSDLKAFKNINVVFEHVAGTRDQLNVILQMTPVFRQSLTAETEGTNTSGNLGIAGSLIYQNRNTFRGAELMEIKIKGGLTAQKNFGIQADPSLATGGLNLFNTFQLGPEFNLYFPRQLFPFTLFHFDKNAAPKTVVTSSANYQKRPEFGRTLLNASYGFQWKYTDYLRFNLVPAEVNVIKVSQLSSNFAQNLSNSNDYFLKNSFRDHITTVSRFTFFYNNQTKPKAKKLTFLKVNLEASGNILRTLFNATNQPKDITGSYRIAGIPFAQFLRFDIDYRYYIHIRRNRLVLRTFVGLGHPFANLSVLPYEKSFFGGGPNSVRAWKARSLGPGGYNNANSNASFDKLGDMQLEGNIEYRFPVYKVLNGAFFVDAGNIWLSKPDPNKPLGDFQVNRFYKEIAIGTGIGIRADFSFFIIRLDASIPIHDPKFLVGERWIFQKSTTIIKTSPIVVNFGIGYPF